MDVEKFVRNVKEFCKIRQIDPTNACIESGLNRSFLSDLAKGKSKNPRFHSIEKLANYLGVPASDLIGESYVKHTIGEIVDTSGVSEEAMSMALAYDRASEPIQKIVRSALEPYIPPTAYKKPT